MELTTSYILLAIVARENLFLEQMDVMTAFLHGDLDEEIYMKQPDGFKVRGNENLVWKLKKSLYELKQALRKWYIKFDTFMCSSGTSRINAYCCG